MVGCFNKLVPILWIINEMVGMFNNRCTRHIVKFHLLRLKALMSFDPIEALISSFASSNMDTRIKFIKRKSHTHHIVKFLSLQLKALMLSDPIEALISSFTSYNVDTRIKFIKRKSYTHHIVKFLSLQLMALMLTNWDSYNDPRSLFWVVNVETTV